MTVAATSLEAFDHLRETGKLTAREQQVIAVMKPGRDYSLTELSSLCGLPVNCISGRVTALKAPDRGLLIHAESRRKCRITGHSCLPVMLPAPDGA